MLIETHLVSFLVIRIETNRKLCGDFPVSTNSRLQMSNFYSHETVKKKMHFYFYANNVEAGWLV
jgi:hypothetical protein